MTKEKGGRLGPALRAARRRLGLTAAEVSKRTGISASTLSRVENRQASLTYDALVRLADGLSLDIAEFFRPPSAAAPGVTARRSVDRSDGAIVRTPKYIYRYLHADLSGKRLVPIAGEHLLHDIKDFGEYHRHPGEEFIYVLEGTMELYTDFYAPTRLEAGHSIYIDGTMGHAYIAVGDKPCRILAVMTAPEGGAVVESHLREMAPSPERLSPPSTPKRARRVSFPRSKRR